MVRAKAAVAVRSLRGKTGASRIVLGHIGRLIRLGYEVHLFSEKIVAEMVRASGAVPHKLWRLPAGRFFSRLWYAKRVNALVDRGSFSLIVGHGDIFRQDLLFLHNLVRRQIEMLAGRAQRTLAAPADIHDRVFKARAFKLCIANSRMMKTDLVDRHQIPANRIQVVYPGYPEEQFSLGGREKNRKTFRGYLELSDNIVIGFVTSGAFELRGFDIFLDTLCLLDHSMLSQVAAVIVGDSKKVDRYLKDRSVPAILRSKIRTIPKRVRIEEVYHGLDILFYPSRFDTFGLVVEEAAVCGLPVLTTMQVGASELFNDQARELLIQKPDAREFADKLRLLIAYRDYRCKMAVASRQSFVHNTEEQYFDTVVSHCGRCGLLPE